MTKAEIDANYQNFIDTAKNGTFAPVSGSICDLLFSGSSNYEHQRGAIILTHEINKFTMQEAMDYYEHLQEAFQVSFLGFPETRVMTKTVAVYCSCWCSL